MTFTIEKERITAVHADGVPMGYITFPRVRNNLVNINLVVTHPRFRGQGVAESMMEALLIHLDVRKQKAALTAPLAQQYLERHREWRHLLPGEMHFTTH